MSALTNFKGDAPWLYDLVIQIPQNPGFSALGIIDAGTERVAFIGNIWHPTVKTGTINIRKVHFHCGAVTFNAASVLRVSLQDVSATAGPPIQPDGVQDQTADMTALAANAWNTTGNLSADRVVDLSAINPTDANSRHVAVVFEYQTFTAADSVVIRGMNPQAAPLNSLLGGLGMLFTGTWALLSVYPIVAFECDDGTFAFMDGGYPFTALTTASVSSTAAIRAAGLIFSLPVQTKIEGIGLGLMIPNGCDGTIKLYDSDGTTELASVAVDNDAVAAASLMRHAVARIPPVTLAANTDYRMVYVGGTATAASVYYGDVNAAALMDGLVGGQDFHWTQRDSAGTWTETTTRRPHLMLKLSAVHDGAGGGAGGMLQGNMRGNFQ